MRRGFSLIELVFVIVVMGILARFGTNLMMTAYEAYAQSSTNNRLQNDAELTLKQIANRLQYRIKDSIIARDLTLAAPNFRALSSANGAGFTAMEWIGYDIDGWLGLNNNAGFNSPTWSGFIDVDTPAAVNALNYLDSNGSNTANANTVITSLRANPSTTTFNNSAIFFTGANSDIITDYGWDGLAETNQTITAAHRVDANLTQVTQLVDGMGGTSNFAGTDIYENYKLAWTAYSLAIEGTDLVLYYDYQPWEGETFANNGTRVLLLQNVDTFKFAAIGDTIRVQVCVSEPNPSVGGLYAICKETAIF